ncbi:hypothetical protein AC578_8324 [Pseudocercospora eumusae]|uniref:Uncharacterized protein n=1 Tax=Pseudocercospora eumusae TaxID=321146 RepID=A0A139H365_9PEZI|nr:hypothetical protein AC578_8324 [Pseudocercospora eumusae]
MFGYVQGQACKDVSRDRGPHEFYNTDPNYFEDPLEFKPNRNFDYDPKKGYDVADLGTIRTYGG